MDPLVTLAVEADDVPTISQLDAMLTELNDRPKCAATTDLVDGLLELRSALYAT